MCVVRMAIFVDVGLNFIIFIIIVNIYCPCFVSFPSLKQRFQKTTRYFYQKLQTVEVTLKREEKWI